MVCTKEVGKSNVCRFYIPISPNIMESRQNHFWYALIAPPFPPISPPIQYLPYLSFSYIILTTYQLSQSAARPQSASPTHSTASGDTMTVVTVNRLSRGCERGGGTGGGRRLGQGA
jgi:hypothetical protein